MKAPYLIVEMANAHGGQKTRLLETLDALQGLPIPALGVKFQPFHPDGIALPDYSYYSVYQQLFLTPNDWREIIGVAREKVGEVWLDIFDTYGVEVLQQNRLQIRGVKLQASVLENLEVFEVLKDGDWSKQDIILNVSGQDLETIGMLIERYSGFGLRGPVILQVGYQRYPARLEETPLEKIPVLRNAFPGHPICFADHVAATDPMALRVPLLATAMGCDYIEKHVCLRRADSKYDHISALEPTEMRMLAAELAACDRFNNTRFISVAERKYVDESQQVPVLAQPKRAGQLLAPSDLLFRRSNTPGLTLSELRAWQSRHRMMLACDVPKHSVLKASFFRQARVAVIVACRMKSSRLPQKAILPIRGVSSVERCLQNCLLFPADQVILATSTAPEDAVLKGHTLSGAVKFWQGDPDDVILRYLGACEAFGVDVVIRVTADCPLVSPEIAKFLLEDHFQSGADYTAPRHCAVGSGSEIYNVEALRRVLEYLGRADYSEYMTWYMRNNQDIFRVNVVDLPAELVRDYRLTLDYPEDLHMFEALYTQLEKERRDTTLKNVFAVLDAHPEIAMLNKHLTLTYQTDPVLIEKLNRLTRIVRPT